MGNWSLNETVPTSAGLVRAGRTGDGPDLVLAHGWPWSSFSWHRVIPELARRYRVHWYDMPGYGQSDKAAAQRTSLDVQGKIFAEMLAHWHLVCPSVIAHDFGGAATLRAHLLHGCNYERYVLMNIVAMRPWGSAFFDHMGKHVEAFQGLPAHIHRTLVEAYIKGALIGAIADDDIDGLVAPWLTEDGAASFYRQFTQADEHYTAEIEPMFGEVRCPVKIVWGEADPWIPLARARALHALMPRAAFETIPGVGHMPQLEAPERFLSSVDDFI
ncbi:pimeloyl-ACP methyl ester carboxylesterase [Aminobacter lissarensis]|uniref:Pimeloyl-ACP methyl ester carboxylesterase n=1 Tax=Aminobacter carboxidus TaxID=376165 RepID=A0A8E2B9M0_9HYPH|nr:alpha/beta fold hydrolase [Aminobacter lissarensis]MBB6464601.1 pimeloyl-ACP methyl ester carboxylesterase [Aminobacter lissarensis]